MTDLGVPPGFSDSTGYGINNNGQVVGYCGNGTVNHAVLYDGKTTIDLNNLIPAISGWTLEYATAINDNGWIVGDGSNSLGQQHAFLLTPFVIVPPLISDMTRNGNTLTFSFSTQTNATYVVESKTSLSDASWTPVQILAGTGGNMPVNCTNTASTQFYRVRVQ